MPETMESARRWSGYVCPDCRFVFRVPRDHDGTGIVCPSCRRMLRIPTAADAPPPLMAAVRRVKAEDPPVGEEPQVVKKRRRGRKASGSSSHSWEHQSKSSRSGRGEKRQLRWMLAGGVTLLALIVGGVIVALNPEDEAAPVATIPVTTLEQPAVEAAAVPLATRGEAAILSEAEPLARKFLEATRVDELLPLVRNPELAEARMRKFYSAEMLKAPGLTEINPGEEFFIRGKLVSFIVRTRDYEDKSMAMVETPEGLKIDWESWVGWSEMAWEDFLLTRPAGEHVFRVILSPVDYYNFGFSDDSKWQSYRLTSPDREDSVYGYVEKNSVLDQKIRPVGDAKNIPMILALKFPPDASSGGQVLIERLVADGWVEEGEAP